MRPLSKHFLLILLAAAPCAVGQNTQIGAVFGYGGAVRVFETSAYHVIGGAEACLRCGGRFGIFAEYDHWAKVSSGTDRPASLDLGMGGIRIQGKGRRVRPFFDVGFVVGREANDIRFFGSGPKSVSGGTFGVGAAVSLGDRWYVRPMVRIIGLSTSTLGGFAGAGFGYRF